MTIGLGWQIAGSLAASVFLFGAGYLKGVDVEKDRKTVELRDQTIVDLEQRLKEQSELAYKNAELALEADLRAQEASAAAAAQKPIIRTRYIEVEKELEKSDDEIFDAFVPADYMRAFNCLLDERPDTGDCEGNPSGSATSAGRGSPLVLSGDTGSDPSER